MSLAENIARRRHQPLELLRGITLLREKGFATREISAKTNLHETYVRQMLELVDKGEERLLVAAIFVLTQKQITTSFSIRWA